MLPSRALLGVTLGVLPLALLRSLGARQSGQRALGGVRVAPSPQVTNQPPLLDVGLASGTVASTEEELSFLVQASDPDGQALSVRCLNPPPGMVFDPVRNASGPVSIDVRWLVAMSGGGQQKVIFEARDEGTPPGVTRVERSVRIRGGSGTDTLFWDWARTAMVTGDVTGDGQIDVVVMAPLADVGGVSDVGAVLVWEGGPSPAGPARAKLSVPGATAGDRLSEGLLRLADVTGDGVLDVIAVSSYATVAGVSGAGAVYVWAGGEGLKGSLAPTAELSVASVGVDGHLGSSVGQSVHLVDVTGDGELDVVALAQQADAGGVIDAGAAFVWAGGAALVGTPSPTASLNVPDARAGDQLGTAWIESALFEDVTGDGVLDLVIGSYLADTETVSDAGALYVWAGGSALRGSVTPLATLRHPDPWPGDRLGDLRSFERNGFVLADFTGDGTADVLTGSSMIDRLGVADVGALYLWAGGGSLAGNPEPTATLVRENALAGDRLGSGRGAGIADVTGDGVLDVLAGTEYVGRDLDFPRTGAIYVWTGGPTLVGTKEPGASLSDPSSSANARLTATFGTQVESSRSPGHVLEDVTGDGLADVIGVAFYDSATAQESGSILVWAGGTLSGPTPPTVKLTDPDARSYDRVGATKRGVRFADLTGDGVLDVIGASTQINSFWASTLGGALVWAGGANLMGPGALTAKLYEGGSGVLSYRYYTSDEQANGPNLWCGDVTGDGVDDLLMGSNDASRILLFRGGGTLAGEPAPFARLKAGTELTATTAAVPFQLVDADDDGVLDVLAPDSRAPVNGSSSVGAVYLWRGGPGATIKGSPATTRVLTRPVAGTGGGVASSAGEGVLAVDLTGDGVLDVLVLHPGSSAVATQAGALYLFEGPVGPTSPQHVLVDPSAAAYDRLGHWL